MKKRDLFAEMMQGVTEMAAHREGKITLRTFDSVEKPAPSVSAKEIVALRKKLVEQYPDMVERLRKR